jgi:hydrogenase expression/formation protein HypC
MCLGIPGLVLSASGEGLERTARVSFGGVIKEICLAYVPEAVPGDHVIVHVGFAISRVDEDEAARVFAALAELGELAELAERRGP